MKGVATFTGEIETMKTADHPSDNNAWGYTTIKLNRWKEVITENVSKWLVDNGFPSVSYVLESGNHAAIKTLLELYNVEYNDVQAGNYSADNIFSDKTSDNIPTTLIAGTNNKDYINLPENTGSKFIVRSSNGADEA